MLKGLGAVLLLFGCAGLGLIQIKRMDNRIKVLKGLLFSLEIMEREMTYRLPVLEEMLDEAAAEAAEPVAGFLTECSRELKSGLQRPFRELWCETAQEQLSVLKKNELDSLVTLGSVLGRYDGEEQRKTIDRVYTSLEHALLSAAEERKNQGKVYGVLGTTAGAFLVILLL